MINYPNSTQQRTQLTMIVLIFNVLNVWKLIMTEQTMLDSFIKVKVKGISSSRLFDKARRRGFAL